MSENLEFIAQESLHIAGRVVRLDEKEIVFRINENDLKIQNLPSQIDVLKKLASLRALWLLNNVALRSLKLPQVHIDSDKHNDEANHQCAIAVLRRISPDVEFRVVKMTELSPSDPPKPRLSQTLRIGDQMFVSHFMGSAGTGFLVEHCIVELMQRLAVKRRATEDEAAVAAKAATKAKSKKRKT
jgi:hypothetical protein